MRDRRTWAPRSRSRLGAALVAVAVTGAFMAALRLPTRRVPPPDPGATTVSVRLAPVRFVPPSEIVRDARPTGLSAAGRTAPRTPAAVPRATPATIPPAETSRPRDEAAASRAEPAASDALPLQLDLPAGAARSARGSVRTMADRAGTDLGETRAPEPERLGEAMAGAAKSDCVGPNAQGSLLSAVVIAYDIVTGRCR